MSSVFVAKLMNLIHVSVIWFSESFQGVVDAVGFVVVDFDGMD